MNETLIEEKEVLKKRFLFESFLNQLIMIFLSSPIACVACERTELLRTEIHGRFFFCFVFFFFEYGREKSDRHLAEFFRYQNSKKA